MTYDHGEPGAVLTLQLEEEERRREEEAAKTAERTTESE